jgi:hypothetical protein
MAARVLATHIEQKTNGKGRAAFVFGSARRRPAQGGYAAKRRKAIHAALGETM